MPCRSRWLPQRWGQKRLPGNGNFWRRDWDGLTATAEGSRSVAGRGARRDPASEARDLTDPEVIGVEEGKLLALGYAWVQRNKIFLYTG